MEKDKPSEFPIHREMPAVLSCPVSAQTHPSCRRHPQEDGLLPSHLFRVKEKTTEMGSRTIAM